MQEGEMSGTWNDCVWSSQHACQSLFKCRTCLSADSIRQTRTDHYMAVAMFAEEWCSLPSMWKLVDPGSCSVSQHNCSAPFFPLHFWWHIKATCLLHTYALCVREAQCAAYSLPAVKQLNSVVHLCAAAFLATWVFSFIIVQDCQSKWLFLCCHHM